MGAVWAVIGGILILVVAVDVFETIVLPRTVSRPLRLTRIFFDILWRAWSAVVRRMRSTPARESLLAIFGPFALILLISMWGVLLVMGFGLLNWGLQVPLSRAESELPDYLYFSAITFCTLGYGDLTAMNRLGQFLSGLQGGFGFGFFALVIGYVPVLYQSFSRREATILLLDARAGSPPIAIQLLTRYRHDDEGLQDLLFELEKWAAQLLETYLSYPVLAFYRSQHERQTWFGALTAMLDCGSLLKSTIDPEDPQRRHLLGQAKASYAMARHVLVDVAYVLDAPPEEPSRLSSSERQHLEETLRAEGYLATEDAEWSQRFDDERSEYEPYLAGLSRMLVLDAPPWVPSDGARDNWRSTAWDQKRHF